MHRCVQAVQVASLQSILEVSCIGQEVGVVNKDDWIESLEMSLIHAKVGAAVCVAHTCDAD